VKRYLVRYGNEQTERILRLNNDTPESILWVNTFKTSRTEFQKELDKEGITSSSLPDLPNAVKVDAKGFTGHRLYREGLCFFMDVSSQRIAGLIDLTGVGLFGDLCAAPGGKSFVMADRLNKNSRVVCSDINFDRLQETRRRAELYAVPGLEFVQVDLARTAPYASLFDALLLDVPCSGLGTLRSNPDARWRTGESDLARYQERQLVLLQNAFSLLLPGKEMIYSTCSTEPEENEDVIERFLASEPSSRLSGEFFRTLPHQERGEGFFAARVRRI
jgi:16S rRNA (cytosine967-C5)-methyltransferase